MSAIEKRVFRTVSNILGCKINEVNLQSGLLTHYLWDSLAHIMIITAIEEEFEIAIHDEEILELKNVVSIIAFLEGGISQNEKTN